MQTGILSQRHDFHIYFPKELSDRIISAMLSKQELQWKDTERLLDEIIPIIVNFGYEKIPGIKKRLDEAGVKPSQITNFEAYERYFPLITITELAEQGKIKFQLHNKSPSLRAGHSNFEVLGEYILREGKRSVNYFRADITRADSRAATLAIAGLVLGEENIPSLVLVNQKPGDNQGSKYLQEIIVPALELAGIQILRITDEQSRLSNFSDVSLFLPSDNRRVVEIQDTSAFGLIIKADGKSSHGRVLHLGDYDSVLGIFPTLGYRMPIPLLVRAIDSDSIIYKDGSGNINTKKRGRIVVDRLFSAYEIPTAWKSLKDALSMALHHYEYSGKNTFTILELESLSALEGEKYIFKDEFNAVLEEAGLAGRDKITKEDLQKIYAISLHKYYKKSVMIGVPCGTWLLRICYSFAGQVGHNGILKSIIPISHKHDVYVAGTDMPLKYPTAITPYTSLNIIGKIFNGIATVLLPPDLIHSPVRKRTRDVLGGMNLLGKGKSGYLNTASIICPGDFEEMLNVAREYSLLKYNYSLSFYEVVEIMSRLYALVELEFEKTCKGEESMISIFAEKTRIPIGEIRDMLKAVKNEFIDNSGLGIKRMAYSAFCDKDEDIINLPEERLNIGITILKQKKPKSPAFMVTPANITVYDSFYLFSNILLSKITDQSEKNFSIYVRPSESDITFNFLVYNFHKIAKEIDPENKKGLRSMLQKAYWDPRYDKDFLKMAISNAEVGVYYGTAKSYTEARFMAGLDALSKKYSPEHINKMHLIARRSDIEYRIAALDIALEKGIDNALINDLRNFLSKHIIFPETLNAFVILPDAEPTMIKKYAETVLQQVITTRGGDCTNVDKVWIHKSLYQDFLMAFEESACNLAYGDVLNLKTNLAQYDSTTLRKAIEIISHIGSTKIIPPKDLTGKTAELPIHPAQAYTGVIVTEISGDILINDTQKGHLFIKHLAKKLPLPWLNLIIYDELEDLIKSMEIVLHEYRKISDYPRYLYVSAIGGSLANNFEGIIKKKGMTDLFKKGEEAFKQFLPYRPHQGIFFIRALVE